MPLEQVLDPVSRREARRRASSERKWQGERVPTTASEHADRTLVFAAIRAGLRIVLG
jgi:hypothetical protein